jgi:hypothetical protein
VAQRWDEARARAGHVSGQDVVRLMIRRDRASDTSRRYRRPLYRLLQPIQWNPGLSSVMHSADRNHGVAGVMPTRSALTCQSLAVMSVVQYQYRSKSSRHRIHVRPHRCAPTSPAAMRRRTVEGDTPSYAAAARTENSCLDRGTPGSLVVVWNVAITSISVLANRAWWAAHVGSAR